MSHHVQGGNMVPSTAHTQDGQYTILGVTSTLAIIKVNVLQNQTQHPRFFKRLHQMIHVVSGSGCCLLEEEGHLQLHLLAQGDTLAIPSQTVHAFQTGTSGLGLLIASSPDLLDRPVQSVRAEYASLPEIIGGNQLAMVCQKPWGLEAILGVDNRLAMKKVTLYPGQALSRQLHLVKKEIYVVLDGAGSVELGHHAELTHHLSIGDVLSIDQGVVHSLVSDSEGIVIVEVSTPEITDVIRISDRNGRVCNPSFSFSAFRMASAYDYETQPKQGVFAGATHKLHLSTQMV